MKEPRVLDGQVLDIVPEFDRLIEEPNLDLIMVTRRVDEDDPRSGSTWELKNRVNGQPVELTSEQRHYAAAVLRLAAFHLSHHPEKGTRTDHVLYEAREARWQMKLALDYFVGMVRGLVTLQGVETTAKILGMRKSTVDALYSAPSSKRPNLLAEIGAFNVSKKERKKIEKTLASLVLLSIVDDRLTRIEDKR